MTIFNKVKYSGLIGATTVVAVVTLVVKIAAFYKEILIAQKFGISKELDLLILSMTALWFPLGVFASSFQPMFASKFPRLGLDSSGISHNVFLSRSYVLVVLVLSVLGAFSVITAIAFFWIPDSFVSIYDFHTFILFSFLLIPYFIFTGSNLILYSVMFWADRFLVGSFIPIATPLSVLLCLVLVDNCSVISIAAATLFGGVLESIILLCFLWFNGMRFFLDGDLFGREIVESLGRTSSLIFGSILMSGVPLIDQVFASGLAAGSISAISYGGKVTSIFMGLSATALAATTMPYFSKLIAEKNWISARRVFDSGISLVLALFVPVAIFVYTFSSQIVSFVFQRGAFTSQDAELVALVQSGLSLQIPLFIAGTLISRLLLSASANSDILIGSALSFVANLTLNFIFVPIIGVVGIVISTALSYTIQFVYLYFAARKVFRTYSP